MSDERQRATRCGATTQKNQYTLLAPPRRTAHHSLGLCACTPRKQTQNTCYTIVTTRKNEYNTPRTRSLQTRARRNNSVAYARAWCSVRRTHTTANTIVVSVSSATSRIVNNESHRHHNTNEPCGDATDETQPRRRGANATRRDDIASRHADRSARRTPPYGKENSHVMMRDYHCISHIVCD